jgi:CHAT domain-containing protein
MSLAVATFAEALSTAEFAHDRRRAMRTVVLERDDVARLLEEGRRLRQRTPLGALRVARGALAASRLRRDRPLSAEAHRLVGQCSILLGRPRVALHHLRAAERVAEPDLRARLVPEVCGALGLLGRVEEALALLGLARRSARGPGSARARAVLDSFEGNLLLRFDRNEEALRCLDRARRSFLRRDEQAAVAGVDSNRANALCNLHRYGAADRLYRRSAAWYRAAGQDGGARQVEYNHAYLFFLRGEFERALTRFHELRGEFATAGDEYHVALCDMDEAEIDLRLNLSVHAAVHAERAALVLLRLGVGQDAARARFFHAMATRRLSRWKDWPGGLLPVLEAFRQQGCPAWEAICLHRLAEIDLERGDTALARDRASEAARRLFELGFSERAAHAEILVADAEARAGNAPAALQRLLDLERRVRGTYAPWLSCELHHHLGRLYAVLGQVRAAVKHLLRATGVLERHRSTVPPDECMASFLKDKAAVYEDAVFFLLWLGGRRARERALELAEQAKGRALLDLLGMKVPAPVHAASAALCRRADALGGEIEGLLGRLPEASPRPSAGLAVRSREAARTRDGDLRACLEQIAARDPAAASLRTVSAASWDELARGLGPDTTLVEYFVGASELLTFVATREGVSVARTAVGREELAQLVARMRCQLDRPELARSADAADQARLAREADEVLGELHDVLLAPVLPGIRTRRVVIVPHGDLHAVPFQALGRGGRALLDDHVVLTAPSSTVYLRCLAARPARARRCLLMGVPDEAAPLIGEEIRLLAGLLGGAHAYVGEGATRAVLEREAPRARIVHLATHAEWNADDPMRSGLCMGDGLLTLADVYRLRLSPEVLVLSGCATGRSSVTEGDDLFGLLRGFLHAGAASILSSLWRVADAVTVDFMERFHTELARTASPAEATRAAALAIRALHPHPFFWAPFVLTGRG